MLRFASHNVRGMASKVAQLAKVWAQMRLDVVCVQETHVAQADQLSIERLMREVCAAGGFSQWRFYWGDGEPGTSHGVLTLIREALVATGLVQARPCQPPATATQLGVGRLLVLSLRWAGHHLRLANVYAPSSRGPAVKRDFITRCLQPLGDPTKRGDLVLMGDFNFVPTPADRLSQPELWDPAVPRAFQAAFPSQIDLFRALHPHWRQFSHFYVSNGQQGATRLDHIYVPLTARRYFTQCSHGQRMLSDHRPVLACLTAAAPTHVGPGRARLNTAFLQADPVQGGLRRLVRAHFERHLGHLQGVDLMWGWVDFKVQLSEWCTELARAHAQRGRDASAASQQAQARLDLLLTSIDEGWDPDVPATLYAARALLDALCVDHQNRPHDAPWLHCQEEPAPHLTALIRPPPAASLVAALRAADGSLVTDPAKVPDLLNSHFASISARPATELGAQQQVLSALDQQCTHLSAVAYAALASPLLLEGEVQAALRGMAGGSSPGLDGIPPSIYKLMLGREWIRDEDKTEDDYDIISATLTRVFNAAATAGELPVGFLAGVITPLFKDGDHASRTNYRPITVLNTDYRVLTKALTLRLQPHMDAAIDREQTAFLTSRLIGENICLLQSLPSWLSAQQRSAVVAFVDFRKAYDTLDRSFILRCMEVMGVPAGFRQWVQLLLSGTEASTCVNGFQSTPLLTHAGVRQGCPLSPLLYLFVGQALLSWLKQCGVGIALDGSTLTAVQFADDIKIFLADLTPATVDRLQQALLTFARASGQHTNLDKSQLLPVGAPLAVAPPAAVMGMRVVTSATCLGIRFANGFPVPDWEEHLQRAAKPLARIVRMGMSAMGRGLALSAYGTARFLYQAEFSPLPPPPVVVRYTSWQRGVVDSSCAPQQPPKGGGLPADMMQGSPAIGGFGVLPLVSHVRARHLAWFARLAVSSATAHSQWWARVCAAMLDQLGPCAVFHMLALAGAASNGLPAYSHPRLRALFVDQGISRLPLESPLLRMGQALMHAPALAWPAPPPGALHLPADPGPWCHGLPLWHLPWVLAPGQPAPQPLHLAFPLLYASPARPLTLGQAVRASVDGFVPAFPPGHVHPPGYLRGVPALHQLHADVRQLVYCFPAPWVLAAAQHQLLVSQGEAPPHPASVLEVLLEHVEWPLAPAHAAAAPQAAAPPPADGLRLTGLAVRDATRLLQRPVEARRTERHQRFVSLAKPGQLAPLAVARGAIDLRFTLGAVWRLPLCNRRKEVFWRLTLNGVRGAQSATMPCACHAGQPGPLPDPRVHHYWDCAVAHAVVEEMQRVLLASAAAPQLERASVWLMVSPTDQQCNPTVWRGVCLAALNAMDRGRRSLTCARLTWQRAQPLPAPPPPIAQLGLWLTAAADLALVTFWQELTSFARALRGWGKEEDVPCGPDHPFIRYLGPDPVTDQRTYGVSLPADD